MKKTVLQSAIFILCAIVSVLNPMLEEIQFLKYVLLVGSAFYLFFGWNLPLIKDEKAYIEHGLVSYVYATVFFANFFDSTAIPFARFIVWFGCLLATVLIVYMIINRKKAKPVMVFQSIILWIVAPVPLFI